MSTDTVTIACKLPHGLVLELGYEIVNNGVVRSDKYKSYVLKGTNSNLVIAGQPAILNPEPGVTPNIPKDFWDAWIAAPTKENPRGGQGFRHPAFKNGLIFVIPKDAGAAKELQAEVRKVRSGFEPLDPNKMPEGVTESPVDGRPRLTKPQQAA